MSITYETIHVKKGTKPRLLKLGNAGDTQDSILNHVIDVYEQAEEMRAFWDRYHQYEEQINGIIGD